MLSGTTPRSRWSCSSARFRRRSHPNKITRLSKEIVAGYIDVFERDKGADAFRARVDQMFVSASADIKAYKSLVVELFPKLQYAYSKTLHGASSEKPVGKV